MNTNIDRQFSVVLDLRTSIESQRAMIAQKEAMLKRIANEIYALQADLVALESQERAADQKLFDLWQEEKHTKLDSMSLVDVLDAVNGNDEPAVVETVEAKSLYTICKDRYWDEVDAELAKLGYKRAFDQPGWYVTITVDGEAVKVWATDGK